jgi:hypothetical protein
MKFGHSSLDVQTLDLVDGEENRLSASAKVVREFLIRRRQSTAPVGQEYDRVAFFDRLPCLAPHVRLNRRIDIAAPPVPKLSIPRQPGDIRHQRIAPPRQTVEQGRFPHIGPTHENDNGFHDGARPSAREVYFDFSFRAARLPLRVLT